MTRELLTEKILDIKRASTMSGKFLHYKYYGSEAGIPGYGLKKE